MARRGPDFGVLTKNIEIDFQKVMQRQNTIRSETSQGLKNWLENLQNVDVYHSYGEFENSHIIRAGNKLIKGETIVINTGGRPRMLPIEGIEQINWLDNVRLLDLKELPLHLIIVGGSYISLEFAQAFRRLGSQVTVLEGSPQLMFREDADIASSAQDILEGEGINIQ